MIHWKLLRGLCLSPLKHFCVHVSLSPYCSSCPRGALGACMHFFLGGALQFLFSDLSLLVTCSFLLEKDVVLTLDLLFLDGFPGLALSPQQRNLHLTALTAACF